jgi:hypothetical protein
MQGTVYALVRVATVKVRKRKRRKPRRTSNRVLFVCLSDELARVLDASVEAKQLREPDRVVSRAEVVRELIRNSPDALKKSAGEP